MSLTRKTNIHLSVHIYVLYILSNNHLSVHLYASYT